MPKPKQPKLPKDFKALPEFFEKQGRHFKLIKRQGNVAIYAIAFSTPKDWSKVRTYEVVLIRQVLVGRTVKGYYMPPHEELPSAEQWGSRGFSPPDLVRAEEIFQSLVQRRGA